MGALLWLTVAVPAAAAALVRVAPAGDRRLAVAGALVAAVPAGLLAAAALDEETATTGVRWLAAAEIDAGLRLDGLSAAMAATVAAVGLAVVAYSAGYFAEDPRRRSALAGLLGFLAAMQGLVLADGYLTLLIFWELVGAASARLIAFNRADPRAPGGAVTAFLTTRSADLGLYVAVLALFAATGSLAFADARPAGALGVLVALGLIVAAVGKSAQAPLQTWLMGAMAGPTPVSALLHSATMVAAGVYLLMRSHDLLAGWPLLAVGAVGAITAVTSAAIALAQDDLKRLLAGSTSSQLGLMFVGLAAGGPVVALFHLVAHAAGKACLFLATGMFAHRRGGTGLDVLRGAGREDRAAFACFVIAALSIAAVPPLAGFWSKEHVTAAAEQHATWFALVILAAAGAAAYLLRPALILWDRSGAVSAGAGVAGRAPMLAGTGGLAAAALAGGLAAAPLKDLVPGALPSSTLSLAASLAAVAAGAAAILAAPAVPRRLSSLARREFLTNELLRWVAVRPALALASVTDAADRRGLDAAVDGTGRGAVHAASVTDAVERGGIDAAVDGVARLVGAGGARSRRLQTGRLYEYLRGTALGAAALAGLLTLTALL